MDYYEFDLAGAARFADDFVGGALSSSEVGDGNLNRVFRVGANAARWSSSRPCRT
ncbi:hypothetical protein GCM10025881_15190 [Pseudolysinimonas kribbensis]|uniref:Uncharacterized protein n=2 Tax=Pseudolysinimonas kribbensis TaxID=433641 RepID=A0ABQ6K252_9MICO|nr:hypothetical protein GCM10025881_15190 [Pseudolysinimonas kribbensis]